MSAGTVACAGSGSWFRPGLGAGRLRDYVSVGRTAGPAGGSWCRWDANLACAGACGWSPGAVALRVAVAWGPGLSVGLWAWGRTVPKGRVLVVSVGPAVRVCVRGPLAGACAGPSVRRFGVPWRGRGSGWACCPLPGGLPAGGRVWTRQVVFGVVEPGRLWGRGVGPFAGVRCEGVVRVGCLLPPYSWGWTRLRFRQVTPGVLGSLWLCGVVAGVVVPPVWMHVLVGGSVACRPPMVPERP